MLKVLGFMAAIVVPLTGCDVVRSASYCCGETSRALAAEDAGASQAGYSNAVFTVER